MAPTHTEHAHTCETTPESTQRSTQRSTRRSILRLFDLAAAGSLKWVELPSCLDHRRDGVGPSRRRDCHFADIPSPSLLKRLLKGEGGAAKWQSRRRLVGPRDLARRQAVRRDAVLTELGRQPSGQVDDGSLGRLI